MENRSKWCWNSLILSTPLWNRKPTPAKLSDKIWPVLIKFSLVCGKKNTKSSNLVQLYWRYIDLRKFFYCEINCKNRMRSLEERKLSEQMREFCQNDWKQIDSDTRTWKIATVKLITINIIKGKINKDSLKL